MLCPNFTSNDSLLPLAQPSSLPVFSVFLSLSPLMTLGIRHHIQKPKVPRPSSVSLHRSQVAHSIDTGHPLSPQHLWPLTSRPLLSSSLPQLKPALNSYKSAPSLLNPTSNAPSPRTFPNFLFPSTPPLLSSAHPSPSPPPPPHPHLVLSTQVNLARCAADVSSRLDAGRWSWRSRRWKPATRSARGGTSSPRPRSWVSSTTPTWSVWRACWRGYAPSSSSPNSWRTERLIPSSG